MKPVRLTGPPEIRRDVFDQWRVPDHHVPPSENGFVADADGIRSGEAVVFKVDRSEDRSKNHL